jgi:spore coat protein CotF
LFNSYAQQEQQHYNTLEQILQGQTPSMQGQQQQQQQQVPGQNLQGSNNPNDAGLCNDMLMTEKYVSGTYDTAIFECQQNSVRQVLNHIQKEEQEHGEGIFNYMKNSGMYQPQ